jgi:Mlc titration factor MtfA (ptsG expression regulator)
MLDWLFGNRKKIHSQPITEQEELQLNASIWQARFLPASTRYALIRWVRVFIAEKKWEGCNGLQVDVAMQWTVAASAGLMVTAYPDWFFGKTSSILMYPTPYIAKAGPQYSSLSEGIPAVMGEFARAGETIYRGPVIVNWRDLQYARESANSGNHLAIHEFAHQLDLINSPFADGLPPLPAAIDESPWKEGMQREFQAARSMVADGYRVFINDYGLTKESEFFAVASELYFQSPHALAEYHPNVFELLRQFYQQDLRQFLPS